MPTLREVGELELILRLRAMRAAAAEPGGNTRGATGPGSAADDVVVAAGDDAAILRVRAGRELVATTDTLLEGTHFTRDWIDAGSLGARLVEANLSDIAAMAGEPRWALVSYGMRSEHDADDLEGIQRGVVAALARHAAVVAGGNLTAVTHEEWLTLTLLGEVEPGRAWTRAGARPGDLMAVTGRPGRAGAGSALASALGEAARAPQWAELIAAWRTPRARIELALTLAREDVVTAAIDISDGVSTDLANLCDASGVGARIEAAAWPEDAALTAAAAALRATVDALRLGASDDYELILAVEPSGREAAMRIARGLDVPLAFVGAFTAAPGVIEWVGTDGVIRAVEPGGYEHFARGEGSG